MLHFGDWLNADPESRITLLLPIQLTGIGPFSTHIGNAYTICHILGDPEVTANLYRILRICIGKIA